MTKKRIGMTLVSYDGGIDQVLDDAKLAEELGFDDVWFGDVGAPDALTMAGVIADRTESVRIGTAVIPVFTRTPAVLAASASTLQRLSQGRFMLGLGSSSPQMIENWHGLKFEKPLTRVKESVELLRAILAGEKSDFSGQTVTSHRYQQAPADPAVPIYLAALRPKMLALAGQIADGVIFNFFPRKALPNILQHVHEGLDRAHRTPDDIDIVCRFQVVVTEEVDAYIEMLRQFLAPYFAQSVYNRFLAWCGYPKIAATINEGWQKKDRAMTTSAMTTELLHEIAIIGDKDYCQQRIREYAEMGIDTLILSCPSLDPETRLRTFEAFSKQHFSF